MRMVSGIWRLAGGSVRQAAVVIGADGNVLHTEMVSEVVDEPDTTRYRCAGQRRLQMCTAEAPVSLSVIH